MNSYVICLILFIVASGFVSFALTILIGMLIAKYVRYK